MSFPLGNEIEVHDDRKSFLANASFPKKLYDLVFNGDRRIVRWEEHGRAFRIVDSEKFSNEILPMYFRHSKLTSFQRQLNLYGFRRITKGDDQGSYYHAKFQRGKPNALSEIRRLQGKAMPMQAGVNTYSVPGLTYGNKKDVQVVDNSYPLAQSVLIPSDTQIMPELEYSVPLDLSDSHDQNLPPSSPQGQVQLPSGFGGLDDTTPSFSRNVSDFGWCNSGFEGLEDFDPLDMNLLDALFDDVTPAC